MYNPKSFGMKGVGKLGNSADASKKSWKLNTPKQKAPLSSSSNTDANASGAISGHNAVISKIKSTGHAMGGMKMKL